jgi:uncharacterized protein GlcG (DUF336 family)
MSKIQEPVPDAWKEGKLPYGPSITLATAKKMLDAAEAEAKKQGLLMVMSIADTGGNLVAFSRMDNAMLLSIQIAMDKAFTAAFSKVPSEVWRNILRAGMLPQLFIHERLMPLPGGFPLIKNGQLMGGLGVSGATALGDTSVARAALVAGGFSTQDIDAILVELQGT